MIVHPLLGSLPARSFILPLEEGRFISQSVGVVLAAAASNTMAPGNYEPLVQRARPVVRITVHSAAPAASPSVATTVPVVSVATALTCYAELHACCVDGELFVGFSLVPIAPTIGVLADPEVVPLGTSRLSMPIASAAVLVSCQPVQPLPLHQVAGWPAPLSPLRAPYLCPPGSVAGSSISAAASSSGSGRGGSGMNTPFPSSSAEPASPEDAPLASALAPTNQLAASPTGYAAVSVRGAVGGGGNEPAGGGETLPTVDPEAPLTLLDHEHLDVELEAFLGALDEQEQVCCPEKQGGASRPSRSASASGQSGQGAPPPLGNEPITISPPTSPPWEVPASPRLLGSRGHSSGSDELSVFIQKLIIVSLFALMLISPKLLGDEPECQPPFWMLTAMLAQFAGQAFYLHHFGADKFATLWIVSLHLPLVTSTPELMLKSTQDIIDFWLEQDKCANQFSMQLMYVGLGCIHAASVRPTSWKVRHICFFVGSYLLVDTTYYVVRDEVVSPALLFGYDCKCVLVPFLVGAILMQALLHGVDGSRGSQKAGYIGQCYRARLVCAP